MEASYTKDIRFDNINSPHAGFLKGEYDNCQFFSCDFSNADLSGYTFSDCLFTDCNLSLSKLIQTAFSDCVFKDCKMLGLHFENCQPFGLTVRFENCVLNHSSFYKTKIKNTVFNNSSLQEVDFTDADLSVCTFHQCDFTNAHFENSNLEKADFTTAFNFTIDPTVNRMKKAKFSQQQLDGLLRNYDIIIIS